MKTRISLVCAGLVGLWGCSILPEYGKIELDHISHIQTGQLGSCISSEDCITQVNVLVGYERKDGKWYVEGGLGWMPKNQGFYGGELTATARFGRKIRWKE